MFGVSIGPPYEAIAENPTSSSTAYTTLGAPSGALGGSNGDQSGTESRMSTSILPLNGLLIRCAPPRRPRSGAAVLADTNADPRPPRTHAHPPFRMKAPKAETSGPGIVSRGPRVRP